MLSLNYRIIFHIDMNCFYASCEISKKPGLAKKPIVVAQNDVFRKSIILTASYEARKYGIKTTMQTKEAIKLCPQLIIVEPNYQTYQDYSHKFFDYLYSITNKVEPTSIDEGYLDVTDVCQKINAITLAEKIQNTLLTKYQLPCSIGIAPNKFLAKMASDMKKPLGITVLRKREVDKILWPLPIENMLGVGKKTKPRLQEIGINTIGDVVNYKNIDLLRKTVGNAMTNYLFDRAHGNDNSPVDYHSIDDVSSVSNSYTFNYDVFNVKHIKDTLKVLTNSVSNRLLNQNLIAQTIGIQIKYSDFNMINRSTGLDKGVNDSLELWKLVEDLFDDHYDDVSEVRLVGVFATRLSESYSKIKQFTIFDDINQISRENKVDQILNKIKNVYGNDSIRFGYYEYKQKDENK